MRKTVLDGIDFEVPRGQIVCLLGPSGCGKTTMVDLIIGNTIPVAGSVTVLGEQAPYPHARKKVGYMPQDEALYDDITAEENLRFFGAMVGLSGAHLSDRMTELLQFAKLEDDRKKLVSHYSGGMKRRLSLAVAMLHEPELLVLDEPTVGLDPAHRRVIWDEFDRLAAEGTTILVTTHIMDEAARCHRIVMLQNGRIIAQGSPEDILAQTGTSDLESAFLALDMGEAPGAGEGPGAGEEPDAGKEPGAGEGSDAGKEATDA
ncbi:MAG: ABC transporter ATP-binding protein [Eggerthellaceae bacterium]|nr:ABC transporter ATP-binding protein [Eggerthellaceae bacterium]